MSASLWNRPLGLAEVAAAIAALVATGFAGQWVLDRIVLRTRASRSPVEPDFVWSWIPELGGIVTWLDQVYEVRAGELPKGARLAVGALSDRSFLMLQRIGIGGWKGPRRLEAGSMLAARVVEARAGRFGWRIDTLEPDGYVEYLFGSEAEARSVLELFRRRVLTPASDAVGERELDEARRRFEADEAREIAELETDSGS